MRRLRVVWVRRLLRVVLGSKLRVAVELGIVRVYSRAQAPAVSELYSTTFQIGTGTCKIANKCYST
jgi:hypothetical protein